MALRIGNFRANFLSSNESFDVLFGLGGADTFELLGPGALAFGGRGADEFIFGDGDYTVHLGHDRDEDQIILQGDARFTAVGVAGFEPGTDKINLVALGVTGIDQLSIGELGDRTFVEFNNLAVVLTDLGEELDEDDFIFFEPLPFPEITSDPVSPDLTLGF